MFKLESPFKPTGDQPQAIEKLVFGVREGLKNQVLLGVTGSGKTFTMANLIKEVNMPALVISHNKTLAGQLYQEFRDFSQKTLFVILFLIMITINQRLIFLKLTLILKKR